MNTPTHPAAAELPELPPSRGWLYLHSTGAVSQVHGYSAADMRAYALAALTQQKSDDDALTVAYMLGSHDGKKRAQQPKASLMGIPVTRSGVLPEDAVVAIQQPAYYKGVTLVMRGDMTDSGKEYLVVLPEAEVAAWIHEDALPEGYPYKALFPYSKVDGVRMFPVFVPRAATLLQPKAEAEADRDSILRNARFRAAAYNLVNLVEGPGCLRWEDGAGRRLKDAPEWAKFYVSVKDVQNNTAPPQPQPSVDLEQFREAAHAMRREATRDYQRAFERGNLDKVTAADVEARFKRADDKAQHLLSLIDAQREKANG